ncbi:MAG: hypothetical protein GEV05_15440 [Betaproteobacteria bacterium]|nr:hypothetical protein [Betaproteobacteria bacterium]
MKGGRSSRTWNDGHYEVYWPRTPRRTKALRLAPRLDTLNGKTIAQLWDYLFRGDLVFEAIEEALRARFPDVRFVHWKEFGNTHGSDEREVLAQLPQRFKALGVDAAISGMGC